MGYGSNERELAEEQAFGLFNFEVEIDHSFFVGKNGVLVHNACPERWRLALGEPDDALVSAINVHAPRVRSILEEIKDDARADLRRALGPGFGQAHHVIPLELLYSENAHAFVMKAVAGGFDFNGVENGVRVLGHMGSHPVYTGGIRRVLDQLAVANAGAGEIEAAAILRSYAARVKSGFERAKIRGKLQ